LKNTDITGVKFYSNKTRAQVVQNREFEEFDREMADFKRKQEDWLIRKQSDPNAKL